MAQEEGLVAGITKDGWAQVVTDRRDACSDCRASHCCASFESNSKMVIRALNRAGARVGDRVSVSLKSASVVQSATFFYMIPVLGLIVGAIAGGTLSHGLPMNETASAIVFSFVGLGLGFLLTALFSRWMSARHGLTPVITRIIKGSLQAAESVMASEKSTEIPNLDKPALHPPGIARLSRGGRVASRSLRSELRVEDRRGGRGEVDEL